MRAFLVLAALLATATPALADIHDLAPADEYFGMVRMSVLGIRNELGRLERDAAQPGAAPLPLSGRLAVIDEAMRDWRLRYPNDTWLPRFDAQRTRVAALIAIDANPTVRRRRGLDALVRAVPILIRRR